MLGIMCYFEMSHSSIPLSTDYFGLMVVFFSNRRVSQFSLVEWRICLLKGGGRFAAFVFV